MIFKKVKLYSRSKNISSLGWDNLHGCSVSFHVYLPNFGDIISMLSHNKSSLRT